MANSRTRRRNIIVFIVVVGLAAAAAYFHHWRYGQWLIETENAQVGGDIVKVSALTGGSVASLEVEQGDYVFAGEVLITLANNDATANYEQALAALQMAVQEVSALAAKRNAQHAEMTRMTEKYTNSQREHLRRISLAADGLLSDESLAASESRVIQNGAALATATAQLTEVERRLGSLPLRDHPQITLASQQLRLAAYRLNKHQVRAPVSGYIAKRYANPGQMIEAGSPLFTLSDPVQRWVEANFKEDQLRNLRIGQPVVIYSDLYGKEIEFTGVVAGPALATGAAFALLPAQNATGNWVKILQRVPVRIEFSPPVSADTPLPVGASLHVSVDSHDRTGARLSDPTQARQLRRAARKQIDYSGDVEQVIADLIEQQLLQ
ncbi:MAG: HlyD family efflux transporter periplasmic adaptor subunit [Porticoccaceae bacterium]